jgi:hypothetical protein
MWLIWTSIPSRRPGGGSATGHIADLLRKSLEARSSYLRFIHMAGCPTRSGCPAQWPGISLRSGGRARGERAGSPISIESSLLINTSHVSAAYREGKTIYVIEPAARRLPGAHALA